MISVLVVDDSVVLRRLIADALSRVEGVRVVGTAANGRLGLAKIEALHPDVVTMDIEMPEMDGVTAVRELRKRDGRLPVIMFSTLTAAGASATLDALAAGATDYVTKPSNTGSFTASQEMVRDQLAPRILALGARSRRYPAYEPPPRHPAGVPAPPGRTTGPLGRPGLAPPAVPGRTAAPAGTRYPPAAPRHRPPGPVQVLAIGSSTGGPEALARVLGALPAALPVPVLVVQHMPPVFTKMFAERLDRTCPVHVVEAADAMPVEPGTVYIAPGDRHLTVVRRGTTVVTRLTGDPPENSCRPAVDVLFRSMVPVYGGAVLAAVLTGMGHDGRRGAELLRTAGAEIVAQDEASSVVWGMPGAVVEGGLADAVLPLDSIAHHLSSKATAGLGGKSKVVIP